MKMFSKMNYNDSMAIAIIALCGFVTKIRGQEFIHNNNNNEEMTTTNFDFFNSESNSGEILDLPQSTKNYQEIINHHQNLQPQQQYQQLFDEMIDVDDNFNSSSNSDSFNEYNSTGKKFLSSLQATILPSYEEDISQKSDFLTTMLPLPHYIRMFSSSPSSLSVTVATVLTTAQPPVPPSIININNANKDYMKENESRPSTLLESNEKLASFSMKNSVYAPQKDIIDDDLANNLSISFRKSDTISDNVNITETDITPSSPLASALLSAPSYLSIEDFNQSHLMTTNDNFNDQENNNSSDNSYINYNNDDEKNYIVNGDDNNSSDDQIDILGTTTLVSVPSTIRSKQGKQIQTIKLLPHEALRNFIEDAYIRAPLATLVDTSSNSLGKTKTLWKDTLRSNATLEIVLVAFNASGVSVTYHFQNTITLLTGLDSIQESTTGGNAFFAIIRACELIPYDSAIFISTASIPADTNLAQYAAITLLKKRIRLYLIWFGEKTFNENETQEVTGGILGEVAIRSGGEILHVNEDTDTKRYEDNDNTLTILSENYRGEQDMEIPMETTMSNLQVKVDTTIKAATLVTPNGG